MSTKQTYVASTSRFYHDVGTGRGLYRISGFTCTSEHMSKSSDSFSETRVPLSGDRYQLGVMTDGPATDQLPSHRSIHGYRAIGQCMATEPSVNSRLPSLIGQYTATEPSVNTRLPSHRSIHGYRAIGQYTATEPSVNTRLPSHRSIHGYRAIGQYTATEPSVNSRLPSHRSIHGYRAIGQFTTG